MSGFAAVVLAGGAARRMGGTDKPALAVAGRPMLHRVLAAVAEASPRVVVGTAGLALPEGVRLTREDPPGGGPVAATAAGLALLDRGTATVALLAADLPLLTVPAVTALREALAESGADGACYLDESGRRQTLCGVWQLRPLRAAVTRIAADQAGRLAGASIRALLDGLRVSDVSWAGKGPPPWFDCDTDDDVRRAEEWTR